jgi:hypothetical protein
MTITTTAPTTTVVGKITPKSGNAKTGPIPVTSRAQWSCPTSCPFFGAGCYGENRGRNPRTLFDLAADAETVHTTESLAAEMRRAGNPRRFGGRALRRVLPIVRDREVGDVLTAAGAIDHAWLSVVTDAARSVGRTVFGYTHVTTLTAEDVPDGYVMNASTETTEDVRDAHGRGLPAVIVGDRDALAESDPATRYVSCPAESRDVTCAECGLCAMPSRMSDPSGAPVIVFAPHGVKAKTVRQTVARLTLARP